MYVVLHGTAGVPHESTKVQNVKQKVVVGIVSGFGGIGEFHFKTILDSWLKVNMKEVVCPNAALMYPHEAAD
jgi:hypothetical protein